MSNVLFAVAVAIAVVVIGCIPSEQTFDPVDEQDQQSVPAVPLDSKEEKTEPMQPNEQPAPLGSTSRSFEVVNHRSDNTGQVKSYDLSIYWSGNTNYGVDPIDVINVTIERMEFEQTTDMQSDNKARALAHMLQARAELLGKQSTTDDGFPLIQ